MKSLVLGIMIASVSMSFAQNDSQSTHELKKKFEAKRSMTVDPAALEIRDNSEPKQVEVLSRKDVKSDITHGVIRVVDGTPFIEIQTDRVLRRMMPVDFSKAMAVDGQEIQFRYSVSDNPLPKHVECSMVINVYNISIVKKR